MKPLSKTTAGDDCTISWLMGLPEAVNYLRKANVREGSLLHVICNQQGSVLVSCCGRRFMLGDEVAGHIQVVPCT